MIREIARYASIYGRLKNIFIQFALNHHDVLDIKHSMEEMNEFIRFHFS